MDQVAESNARLHRARESDKHALRHVQWHNTSGRSESHKSRSSWEGNANWEPRVGVSTGADSVWQQHAVQPRVDDAITRPQRHSSAVTDEVWKSVVGDHVNRLWVSRSV